MEYKLCDNNKDDSMIIPATESFSPVAIYVKNGENTDTIFEPDSVESEGTDISVYNTYRDGVFFKAFGRTDVCNIDRNQFSSDIITEQFEANGDYGFNFDGNSGREILIADAVKILQACRAGGTRWEIRGTITNTITDISSSKTLGVALYNVTKGKTLAYCYVQLSDIGLYIKDYSFTITRDWSTMSSNYTEGDTVVMYWYSPGSESEYMSCSVTSLSIRSTNTIQTPFTPADLAPGAGSIQVSGSEDQRTVILPAIRSLATGTEDVVERSHEGVTLTRKTKLLSFDGSEAWQHDEEFGRFYLSTSDKKPGEANLTCSHFSSTATDNAICGDESNGNIYIKPSADVCTDIGGWQNFLSEQNSAGTPVQVLYELDESETTDITDTEEGQNIIALKTMPHYTRISSGLYIKSKMRVYDKNQWKAVTRAVRSGMAPAMFPVGYEFTTLDSATGANIIWVVRGHDHHAASDDDLKHSMTLETKYVYSNSNGVYLPMQFDAAEAMYYASEGLPAGTYNFTWSYTTGQLVKGTYQFTLAKAVPAGGQIVLGTNSSSVAISNCKIATYAIPGSNDAIESGIVVAEGSDGTSLSTINKTSASSANLNCAQRIMMGSNNYAHSAVRQWMNSNADAGEAWKATNKFDRAPGWAYDTAGFMSGLPADFLAAVQPAAIPCRTNSVFEVNSLDGTEYAVNQVYEVHDKFFILSRPEIYGNWDSATCKDGELLKYYDELTNTQRIKYDAAGTARSCWIRSPDPSSAHYQRGVYTSGMYDYSYVRAARGVAPACIIA